MGCADAPGSFAPTLAADGSVIQMHLYVASSAGLGDTVPRFRSTTHQPKDAHVKKNLILSFLAVGMFIVGGCDDKKTEAPAAPKAEAPKAEAPKAEAPKAEAPAAGAPAAAAAGGDIGVPECDDYIKKMAGCLDKMPAASKAAMEQGFKASKDAWKQAASTPQGKEGLKTACKAAADALASNPACK
jgi:hypothetical protein